MLHCPRPQKALPDMNFCCTHTRACTHTYTNKMYTDSRPFFIPLPQTHVKAKACTHTHTHSFACIMFFGHPTHFISLTQIHLNGWYAHAHNDLSPLCSCCSHMLCTAKILQTLSPSAGHLTGIIWVWYLLSNYSISVISSCFERTIWDNKCSRFTSATIKAQKWISF